MSNNPKYPISPEHYSKIISGIKLESIELIKFNAERKEKLEVASVPIVEIKFNHSFRHIDDNYVLINSNYLIEAHDEDKPDNIVVKIVLVFYTRLYTKYKFSKNFFKVFKELNLPVNVWPYVRTYTQFLISNMGLPPLTLPYWKTV